MLLAIGLLIAVVSGASVHVLVARQVQGRIDDRVERAAAVVELELGRYVSTARAAAVVRGQDDSADRWPETIVALDLGRELPSHLGINSTTAVTLSGRRAFEAVQPDQGAGPFEVFPLPPDDRPSSTLMLVIDRVAPLEPNRAALGFDVLSNPAAAEAALRAHVLGLPALSEALTLVQETGEQTGLALYVPWTSSSNDDTGVISLVLRGQELLDALRPQLGPLELTLLDETPVGVRTIGTTVRDAEDGGAAASTTLDVFGQRWTMELTGSGAVGSLAERLAGLLTAASITVVSVLGSALVLLTRRREEQAQALADERTADLVAANAELEAASAAKDEFLAVLGHEFRTPLTVIRGFAATVAAGRAGDVSSNISDMLGRIEHQANRLDGLMEDLLIAAGLQNREVSVRTEVVMVSELARQVVAANADRIDGAVVEVPEDLAMLVDPTHCARILSALLSNAAKYGARPIVISGRTEGPYAILAVRDHGPGVPQEVRGRIFERFAQADHGERRRSQGVGLGLAIVRELCEHNGGTAELVDVEGGGACFEIRFPAATSVANAAGDPASAL